MMAIPHKIIASMYRNIIVFISLFLFKDFKIIALQLEPLNAEG